MDSYIVVFVGMVVGKIILVMFLFFEIKIGGVREEDLGK